eukprot:scaffold43745_cov229-Amphora_coffeaeformis.AAC.2
MAPDNTEQRIEQWRQLQRERARSVQLHLFLLSHAAKCENDRCPSPNCARMKALLHHEQDCKVTQKGRCAMCKRLWALVHIHSRQCRNHDSCRVPKCEQIRLSTPWQVQQAHQEQINESPVCRVVNS